MSGFPLPGMGRSVVAIPAPGRGPLNWAGAPSAALDEDGSFVLAYRLRAAEENRMTTAFATSDDGLGWQWHGTRLTPRSGRWDARGARVTTVLPDGRAAYDGRATKDENWFERTGLARRDGDRLVQIGDAPVSVARYLDVLPLPDGGYRIYYEWPAPGQSHELRTELIGR